MRGDIQGNIQLFERMPGMGLVLGFEAYNRNRDHQREIRRRIRSRAGSSRPEGCGNCYMILRRLWDSDLALTLLACFFFGFGAYLSTCTLSFLVHPSTAMPCASYLASRVFPRVPRILLASKSLVFNVFLWLPPCCLRTRENSRVTCFRDLVKFPQPTTVLSGRWRIALGPTKKRCSDVHGTW